MHRVNLRFKTGFFPKIVAVRFDTRHYRKKSLVSENLRSCLSKKS